MKLHALKAGQQYLRYICTDHSEMYESTEMSTPACWSDHICCSETQSHLDHLLDMPPRQNQSTTLQMVFQRIQYRSAKTIPQQWQLMSIDNVIFTVFSMAVIKQKHELYIVRATQNSERERADLVVRFSIIMTLCRRARAQPPARLKTGKTGFIILFHVLVSCAWTLPTSKRRFVIREEAREWRLAREISYRRQRLASKTAESFSTSCSRPGHGMQSEHRNQRKHASSSRGLLYDKQEQWVSRGERGSSATT